MFFSGKGQHWGVIVASWGVMLGTSSWVCQFKGYVGVLPPFFLLLLPFYARYFASLVGKTEKNEGVIAKEEGRRGEEGGGGEKDAKWPKNTKEYKERTNSCK